MGRPERRVVVGVQRAGAGRRRPPAAASGRLAPTDPDGVQLRQLRPGLGGRGRQRQRDPSPVLAGPLLDHRPRFEARRAQVAVQPQCVDGEPAGPADEVTEDQPKGQPGDPALQADADLLAQLVLPGLARGRRPATALFRLGELLGRDPQPLLRLPEGAGEALGLGAAELQERDAGVGRRVGGRLPLLRLGSLLDPQLGHLRQLGPQLLDQGLLLRPVQPGGVERRVDRGLLRLAVVPHGQLDGRVDGQGQVVPLALDLEPQGAVLQRQRQPTDQHLRAGAVQLDVRGPGDEGALPIEGDALNGRGGGELGHGTPSLDGSGGGTLTAGPPGRVGSATGAP